MKAAFFAVACLLLAGSASASRALSSTTANSCLAYGAVNIVVKSGSCKGWAGANCKSHADAEAAFKDAFDVKIVTELCKPARATESATAIARALARVFVSALAKVSCNGQGFGCGYGVARGDAFSTAYANAIAGVAAAAFNGPLSAVCTADIQALAVGIAEASGLATSSACVNGPGAAVHFESRFVQVVSKAIAKVIASASAKVCKGKHDDQATCGADVSGSSVVKPTIIVKPPVSFGNQSGSGTQTGTGNVGFLSKQILACEDEKTRGCCAKPFTCPSSGIIRGPPTNGKGSAELIFKNAFGRVVKCFCH